MKNYFGSRIKTPATLSPWHICAACALLLILACGVQVKQQSLYDGRQPNPRPDGPERIELAVEPLVFSEDDTNFWVADDTSCTTGYVTTETAHSGDRSLRINWNRDPAKCEWAGFGIGWDDWAGKDLSEIYDKAAIEMYVRSKEGKMFGLPVVLTLEDYSGHMAWSYTTNKYFERYYIDEEWQRVVVPLNTFDLEEDGLDLTNIKQLNFELQQSGAAFFDDISIVFYDPPAPQVYLPNEPVPPTDVFPVTLFNDQFVKDGGWGVFSDKCQQIRISKETSSTGNASIHAVWDVSGEDCYTVDFGVNWTEWHPIDLEPFMSTGVIAFDIRSGSGSYTVLPIEVGFKQYDGPFASVKLTSAYMEEGIVDETWRRVKIPFNALGQNADFSKIQQLWFRMEGEGDIFIDNIRLVESGT